MQNKLYMKDFVTALLKDNIPLCYYYHNYEHTLYVLEKVIQIGRHEGCNEKEIELLSAAALWHDTGYINTYANHEQAGCVLAKEHLPAFGFTEDDIILITGMIMATKVPQAPKNKLEEIIADADLEYLGTISAEEKSELLFKELHALIPSLTDAAWHKMQVTFIENHHYFTRYCKEYKEPIKQAYLKELVAAG
jgi:predicted metal-dependent HD superfamily phosphohydrolase